MVLEPKKRAYECRPTTPQTNPSTRPTSTSSSNRRTPLLRRRRGCPCCRGWRRCRPGSPRRPRRPHRPRCRPRSTCRSQRRTRRLRLRWVSFSLRLIDSLVFFQRQILFNTWISSQIRTKLPDWAIWQARAGCFSQAALSLNDSKTLYVAEAFVFAG